MPTTRLPRRCIAVLALVPILISSCSQGGEEQRPGSEVQVEASHHMFGFQTLRAFSSFPIKTRETATDLGTLIMDAESKYFIRRGPDESLRDDYTLAKTGALGVLISRGTRLPRIRFSGAYGLDGDLFDYFFTDRFTDTNSQTVGLFWGTRVIRGTAVITGDWHIFSQHVVFSASQVLDPGNIGRSAGGAIKIDKDGKITGSGLESTKSTLTFAGTAKTFDDGRVDVTVNYKDSQNADDRVFRCGAGKTVILGVDREVADREVGLIALMRKRTDKIDRSELKGDYLCGGHTIFVSPTRSGTDAFNGKLTINGTGGWRLEAVGSSGQDFAYSGSYTAKDDGTLSLTVDSTKETWMGAVDMNYKTVVIVDNFVESRTGSKPPELNILLGLREKPDPDKK